MDEYDSLELSPNKPLMIHNENAHRETPTAAYTWNTLGFNTFIG